MLNMFVEKPTNFIKLNHTASQNEYKTQVCEQNKILAYLLIFLCIVWASEIFHHVSFHFRMKGPDVF